MVEANPHRSIYFTRENLEKIDRVRGTKVKRSTLINEVFKNLDDDWLKSVIQ